MKTFTVRVTQRESFGGDVYGQDFDDYKSAVAAANEETRWESTEQVRIYDGAEVVGTMQGDYS